MKKYSSPSAFTINKLYATLIDLHVLNDKGALIWADDYTDEELPIMCDKIRDGDMIALLSATRVSTVLKIFEERKMSGICLCAAFNPSIAALHNAGPYARAIFATARYLKDNQGKQISTPSACTLYDFKTQNKEPPMIIPVGAYDACTKSKALAKATTMACQTFNRTTEELNDTSERTLRYKDKNKQHMNVLLSNGKGRQEVRTPFSILNAVQRAHGHFEDPVPVKPVLNALNIRWSKNNYVNPPFSCTLAFVKKALDEAVCSKSSSTILMPCSPSTVAFQELLNSPHCKHIGFIRGQVKFKDFKSALPIPLCMVRIEPYARDLRASRGPKVMWVDLEPHIRRNKVPLDKFNIYIPERMSSSSSTTSRKRTRHNQDDQKPTKIVKLEQKSAEEILNQELE